MITIHAITVSQFMLSAICLQLVPTIDSTHPEAREASHPISEAVDLLYQSSDDGKTWQDISQGLPVNQQPDDFFVGESWLYLRVQNELYRSESNLKTPVWKKENVSDLQGASIEFNRSAVMACNYERQVYRNVSSDGTWLPMLTNLTRRSVRGIFETSDGTMLLGCDNGLYKSADDGKSWRQVQNEGWVMDLVESDGVLVATGEKGIMRSTDQGDTWEWVIREGGVGIAIERIKGGFAAIFYSEATQSRRIYASTDGAKIWNAIDQGLKPSLSISSIKQMGNYLICGHPDGIFRSGDKGKTWTLVHSALDKKVVNYGGTWSVVEFNSNKKVLKIFSSGKMLYAVQRDFGC